MGHFAAIDFETANRQPNSACQLGVVIVDDWKIVAEYEWLIRPPRMFFSPLCMRVHGITPRDCMNQPTWEIIWQQAAPILAEHLILGHNVGFDASVLLNCCLHFGIAPPRNELQCTRLISKRAWPDRSGHGLAAVAERLGITFRHHNALEDARASALVAINAAKLNGCHSFQDLEESLGLVRGRFGFDQVRNPRTAKLTRETKQEIGNFRVEPRHYRSDGLPIKHAANRKASLLANAILNNCRDSKPLRDKSVVLINTLLGLDRSEAEDFLKALGANLQSSINMQTQYVIVGTNPISETDDSNENSGDKHREEVEKRKELGQPIYLISQRQLLAMIPSAMSIVLGEA
ncbi:MAG: exonuclease domain-containing protein [Pirellula sp.]|jgi:DNA polymerase-3 subunit epsilon|nr:exonuclease domain-containing protein [Pirellula sp.]